MSISDLAKEENEKGRNFRKAEIETIENNGQKELLKNQGLFSNIP